MVNILPLSAPLIELEMCIFYRIKTLKMYTFYRGIIEFWGVSAFTLSQPITNQGWVQLCNCN